MSIGTSVARGITAGTAVGGGDESASYDGVGTDAGEVAGGGEASLRRFIGRGGELSIMIASSLLPVGAGLLFMSV